MAPYSIDLRQRVLAAVDAGEGTRQQIARRFTVATRWVRKLVAPRARTGEVGLGPDPGGRKPLTQGQAAQALRDAIAKGPDATLDELREAIGFGGCAVTVWRAIARLKITREKSRYGPRSGSTRRSPPGGRSGPSGWARSTRTGPPSSTGVTPRRP